MSTTRAVVTDRRTLLMMLAATAAVLLVSAPRPIGAQTPASAALPGIVNFTPIDAKLAVGGAVSLDAIPELKKRGFKTVINLRKATEPNANVEAEANAVRAAGMTYIGLPFSPADPFDVASMQVEPFLKALADPSNLPLFAHSAGSHRPLALLAIKRVLVDGWSVDKAFDAKDSVVLADGSAGANSARQFVANYVKAHAK